MKELMPQQTQSRHRKHQHFHNFSPIISLFRCLCRIQPTQPYSTELTTCHHSALLYKIIQCHCVTFFMISTANDLSYIELLGGKPVKFAFIGILRTPVMKNSLYPYTPYIHNTPQHKIQKLILHRLPCPMFTYRSFPKRNARRKGNIITIWNCRTLWQLQ